VPGDRDISHEITRREDQMLSALAKLIRKTRATHVDPPPASIDEQFGVEPVIETVDDLKSGVSLYAELLRDQASVDQAHAALLRDLKEAHDASSRIAIAGQPVARPSYIKTLLGAITAYAQANVVDLFATRAEQSYPCGTLKKRQRQPAIVFTGDRKKIEARLTKRCNLHEALEHAARFDEAAALVAPLVTIKVEYNLPAILQRFKAGLITREQIASLGLALDETPAPSISFTPTEL